MVGENKGDIGRAVGTLVFWKDRELNGSDCGALVSVWANRHGRQKEFYDIRDARPGDIVAFGTGWSDAMFGIYLTDGKIATSSVHPGCGGRLVNKMILVRISTEGKPFIGGVHIG